MEATVVLCSFPALEVAREVGSVLVGERLAACVSLCTGVESIYRWEGKIEVAGEVLAVIKTTREGFPALERRLRELHPYEVPEILALPVWAALDAYAAWLGGAVGSGQAG